MKFAYLFIFLFIYNNVWGFNILSLKMYQTSNYLNNLNKNDYKNKVYQNIFKFVNINNNTKIPYDSSIYLNSLDNKNLIKEKIYKFLLNETNISNNTNITKKYKFNTLYFNIRKIEKIFIDKKFSKIILDIRNDKEKNIYYVNDNNECEQVNNLIQLIPNTISKLVISEILDDILGYVYHDIINRH